jgi:hypothetical protein
VERQYVGIDLHCRRSVIVRMDESGETLESVRIDNDPVPLGLAPAEAGPDPDVALEATYGWYWTADVLQAAGDAGASGASVGVALGCSAGEERPAGRDGDRTPAAPQRSA